MSERWQRELEKLRTVGAPSSMRARIDAGPTGEGVPPMPGRRQRVVAGVVAFAVFGGAIAFAWGAFGSSGGTVAAGPEPDGAVFTFVAHPTEGGANPTGTMVFGDESVEAFGTSFCWDFGGGSMCADTIEPEFAESDYGSVPAGTPIAIGGDAESVQGHLDAAGPFPFDRIRSLDTSGDEAMLPTQAGRYIIEFEATWSQGSRTFYFPIRVVNVASAQALVATLNAPPDGSMPELALAYEGRNQDFFAQAGAWPGVDAFDQPLLSFGQPIQPGSEIRVATDALNVNARLRTVLDDGSLSDEEVPLDLSSGSARLPNDPGTFELVLKGTWERGIAVYYVRIQLGAPASSVAPTLSPSPAPAGDAKVPDLIGMADQQAMLILNDLGVHGVVAYRDVEGDEWHVVLTDPPAGAPLPPGTEVELVVAARITPLPAGAEDALACPPADHIEFGGPSTVVLPGGAAFIRGNTEGVRLDDEVVQVTSGDGGSAQLWHIIRDGNVIAVIDSQTLDGIACAGSGVGAA